MRSFLFRPFQYVIVFLAFAMIFGGRSHPATAAIPDFPQNASVRMPGTIDLNGLQVTLDPVRGSQITVAPLALAGIDGLWNPMGRGAQNYVNALAADSNGNIYVGGAFTTVYDSSGVAVPFTAYVAKWNRAAKSWEALGRGASNIVHSLAVDNADNLYVGGSFINVIDAGGSPVAKTIYIAKWNGSAWSALAGGAGSVVKSLAVDSQDVLYVGGLFTAVKDISNVSVPYTAYIAQWSGGTWINLGRGADAEVRALAVDGQDNLYAGGAFAKVYDQLGNLILYTGKIAKWNSGNKSWTALARGVNDQVEAIAVDHQDRVYVGGKFTSAKNSFGGNVAFTTKIAKWDPSVSQWTPLGRGANFTVWEFDEDSQGDVYVAGAFNTVYDDSGAGVPNTGGIAKWHPTEGEWSALAGGAASNVLAVVVDDKDDVYIGGIFNNTNDNNSAAVDFTTRLAKWETGNIFTDGFESGDTSRWSAATGAGSLGEITLRGLCYMCMNTTNPLDGTYDLQINVLNKKPHYLTDGSPSSEKRYRARFYIDIRGLKMGNKNNFKLFQGRKGTKKPFLLLVRKYRKKYQVRAIAKLDSGKVKRTKWYVLPKKSVAVEIDWKSAGTIGNHNGYLQLWVDNRFKQNIASLNNDTMNIEEIRLGVTQRIKKSFNISGNFYLDAFTSNDLYYAGP